MEKIKYFLSSTDDLLIDDKGIKKSENQEKGGLRIGFIDQESLLPGSIEPRDYEGNLNIDPDSDIYATLRFKPLTEQDKLLQLNLTSDGVPLYYESNETMREITARASAHGPIVFQATIDDHGLYNFTLHKPIDHAPQKNLVVNGDFQSDQTTLTETAKGELPGWRRIADTRDEKTEREIQQSLATEPEKPYQCTFYCASHKGHKPQHPLHVYWDDQKLLTIEPEKMQSHAYSFSVLGNPNAQSKLRFKSFDDDLVRNFISNVSVISRAQTTLPIVLAFLFLNDDGHLVSDDFSIKVATTPPLELHNDMPIDVRFEDSVYQTIVINEDNKSDLPLTKINLDTLFDNLNLSEGEREITVVQREEGGVGTNVYEVHVTDQHHGFEPIIVADIQLSFPGGDKGLDVFFKNVQIEDV